MCTYCGPLLNGVTIPHTRMECQYRRTMYCPVCVAYGHSKPKCPNKIAWATRMGLPTTGLKNLTISVRDNEEGVKGVLRRYGMRPGTTKLENRKLLNDLANSMEPTRMIIFVNK
jgi:hypothetical protein